MTTLKDLQIIQGPYTFLSRSTAPSSLLGNYDVDMTTLLSSISGQFGKAILLGTLFPVLIVSILNALITVPLLASGPALQEQLSRIAVGEDKWAAIVLVFVVVVVSGFL